MSLTRLPKINKGEITTYQLLLEIAQGLSTLISDPKALSKAANDAYELDLEAKQKAKEAYADITKANLAKEEAVKQQELAAKIIADANKAKVDANALVESINKERKRLSDRDVEQGALALKLSHQEIDLKDRETKLLAAQNNLQKQLDALAVKQREFNESNAALKEKAEKLRSIVGA